MAEALDAMLAARDALDALHAVLGYLLATHRNMSPPRIARLLETTASKGRKMDIFDELDVFKVEGRKEGLKQGVKQGRAATLLELLEARFGRVPADAKERVLGASEATLARWTLRVLKAPTLEAVLGGRKKAAPVGKRARAS